MTYGNNLRTGKPQEVRDGANESYSSWPSFAHGRVMIWPWIMH
jgi:hypothetical protein